MRKLLLLLISLFVVNVAYAQKVSSNKVEADGTRKVISLAYNLYTKLTSAAGCFLEYTNKDGSEGWYLRITFNEGKRTFNKGSRLLLKTDKDEIIELTNELEIDDVYYLSHDQPTPSYYIDKDNLNKILNSKIVKLRIETKYEYLDRDIKASKFKTNFESMYESIIKNLSIESPLYEGF